MKKDFGKLKKIARVFLGLAVTVSLAAGAVFFVRHPPTFLRVKEVVVMTPLKHLTEFDLIRLSDVGKGDNIMRLSLAQVRRNLLRYPWIKEVRLSKRVPARLFIWVEEQEPVALLELPDATSASSWYFVNKQGGVFKKVEQGDPKDFPILTGLAPAEIKTRLPQMLTLIKSVENSYFVSSLGISEIHWSPREGLALFTKDPCIKLELGGVDGMGGGKGSTETWPEIWEDRLKRFSESWGMIRSTSHSPSVVDLSMERRMVVKQKL